MPVARNPVSEVGGRFGAPMGRADKAHYEDKAGDRHGLTVTDTAPPMYLHRIHINSGGYDSGGAYWGLGAPLYYYEAHCSDIYGYVRGRTREIAKSEVRKAHPNARFYR